jgi:hypothetical protein
MDSGGIVVEVDGSYSHVFLNCLHPWDVGIHHMAMATPPLRLQQPAPKPSIFPSDSDSQHSFTYLCEVPESSMLISFIFITKSEFSCVLAHPTT